MKPEPGTLRRWPLVIYLLACTLILQASPARRGLVNLTQPDASVVTKSVARWKEHPVTIGKRPCVFLILG